jgi:hypothetical protein
MAREALMVGLDPHYSQGMSDWITDRLPTKADGDDDEHVRLATLDRSDYQIANWRCIHPGVPWKHTSDWEPPAEPAPAEMTERALTTHQLLSRLNRVNQELVRRVQEGLI